MAKSAAQTLKNIRAMVPHGDQKPTRDVIATLAAATEEQILSTLKEDVLPYMSMADRLPIDTAGLARKEAV